MELVYVEQGLIWFPTITRFAESAQAHFEFYSPSSCSIPAMAMDGFDHELLFVVLRHSVVMFWQGHS